MNLCYISGSQRGDYEEYHLGCNAVYFSKSPLAVCRKQVGSSQLHSSFLPGILLETENGGDIFPRNTVGPLPNYNVLQPRIWYYPYELCVWEYVVYQGWPCFPSRCTYVPRPTPLMCEVMFGNVYK